MKSLSHNSRITFITLATAKLIENILLLKPEVHHRPVFCQVLSYHVTCVSSWSVPNLR